MGAIPVAAAPNGLIVESYPVSKWRPDVPIESGHPEVVLLEEPNPIEKGWITMYKGPGMGYVLNEDVAKKYEVEPRPVRRLPTGKKPKSQFGDLMVRQPSLPTSWI